MNCTHCGSASTRPNGSSRDRPYRKCNTCNKGFAVGVAKARGRPCINGKRMTAAERKRRSRSKQVEQITQEMTEMKTTELKYELWPDLKPKFEDVEKFDSRIAAEKEKRRPNYKYIEALERDRAIAQTLTDNTAG